MIRLAGQSDRNLKWQRQSYAVSSWEPVVYQDLSTEAKPLEPDERPAVESYDA
ncbi:hypothetical protein [Devosia naphthalenivorans]|uniref:hypothetical protein n=1 Tax=Devosia naphthalenivorans TaxID=2082392 RepID=UPI0013B05690|nr:hypothetical protein [Devosia naphthalenivorans]